LLERFWDSSQHPRGGFAENRGWFSHEWGPGATTGAGGLPGEGPQYPDFDSIISEVDPKRWALLGVG
jgi:hypothetical protein